MSGAVHAPSKGDFAAPPHADPLTEAAEWFVLFASDEATPEDRQHWQAWLDAQPANESAWQRMESTLARFSTLPREVVGATSLALRNTSARKKSWRSRATTFAISATIGTISVLAGWQGYRDSDWSADALTAVGEVRAQRLADGSHLQLDTDTAADIDFSASERLIRLRRGQILIETSADPAPAHRPFSVDTAEGRITALGTRFSVEQEAGGTRVIVLQDRVAVTPRNAPSAVIVQAGEALRFTIDRAEELHSTTPEDVAWSKGMLIADDLPLPEFVRRLGRYTAMPLTCDATVSTVRISGAFPLDKPEQALNAIARTRPVRVEKHADRWLITASVASTGKK